MISCLRFLPLIALGLSAAVAMANPFDAFVGNYSVNSAKCKKGSKETLEGCDTLGLEVKWDAGHKNILVIEYLPQAKVRTHELSGFPAHHLPISCMARLE